MMANAAAAAAAGVPPDPPRDLEPQPSDLECWVSAVNDMLTVPSSDIWTFQDTIFHMLNSVLAIVSPVAREWLILVVDHLTDRVSPYLGHWPFVYDAVFTFFWNIVIPYSWTAERIVEALHGHLAYWVGFLRSAWQSDGWDMRCRRLLVLKEGAEWHVIKGCRGYQDGIYWREWKGVLIMVGMSICCLLSICLHAYFSAPRGKRLLPTERVEIVLNTLWRVLAVVIGAAAAFFNLFIGASHGRFWWFSLFKTMLLEWWRYPSEFWWVWDDPRNHSIFTRSENQVAPTTAPGHPQPPPSPPPPRADTSVLTSVTRWFERREETRIQRLIRELGAERDNLATHRANCLRFHFSDATVLEQPPTEATTDPQWLSQRLQQAEANAERHRRERDAAHAEREDFRQQWTACEEKCRRLRTGYSGVTADDLNSERQRLEARITSLTRHNGSLAQQLIQAIAQRDEQPREVVVQATRQQPTTAEEIAAEVSRLVHILAEKSPNFLSDYSESPGVLQGAILTLRHRLEKDSTEYLKQIQALQTKKDYYEQIFTAREKAGDQNLPVPDSKFSILIQQNADLGSRIGILQTEIDTLHQDAARAKQIPQANATLDQREKDLNLREEDFKLEKANWTQFRNLENDELAEVTKAWDGLIQNLSRRTNITVPTLTVRQSIGQIEDVLVLGVANQLGIQAGPADVDRNERAELQEKCMILEEKCKMLVKKYNALEGTYNHVENEYNHLRSGAGSLFMTKDEKIRRLEAQFADCTINRDRLDQQLTAYAAGLNIGDVSVATAPSQTEVPKPAQTETGGERAWWNPSTLDSAPRTPFSAVMATTLQAAGTTPSSNPISMAPNTPFTPVPVTSSPAVEMAVSPYSLHTKAWNTTAPYHAVSLAATGHQAATAWPAPWNPESAWGAQNTHAAPGTTSGQQRQRVESDTQGSVDDAVGDLGQYETNVGMDYDLDNNDGNQNHNQNFGMSPSTSRGRSQGRADGRGGRGDSRGGRGDSRGGRGDI